jgi:hypothetical protein
MKIFSYIITEVYPHIIHTLVWLTFHPTLPPIQKSPLYKQNTRWVLHQNCNLHTTANDSVFHTVIPVLKRLLHILVIKRGKEDFSICVKLIVICFPCSLLQLFYRSEKPITNLIFLHGTGLSTHLSIFKIISLLVVPEALSSQHKWHMK